MAASDVSLGFQELLALPGTAQDSFAQAASLLDQCCLAPVFPKMCALRPRVSTRCLPTVNVTRRLQPESAEPSAGPGSTGAGFGRADQRTVSGVVLAG
jgi:hypothetical protein